MEGMMKIKKYLLTTVSIFIAFQLFDTFIHMGVLAATYQALAHVWRPHEEMVSLMWVMNLSTFILSALFVYVFIQGNKGKGIVEGIRYGIIIGLFLNVPAALNQYVVYPIPLSLAAQWFVYGVIEFVLCGALIGYIYKPKKVWSADTESQSRREKN